MQRPTGATVAAWGRLFGSRLTLQKGVEPSAMTTMQGAVLPPPEGRYTPENRMGATSPTAKEAKRAATPTSDSETPPPPLPHAAPPPLPTSRSEPELVPSESGVCTQLVQKNTSYLLQDDDRILSLCKQLFYDCQLWYAASRRCRQVGDCACSHSS